LFRRPGRKRRRKSVISSAAKKRGGRVHSFRACSSQEKKKRDGLSPHCILPLARRERKKKPEHPRHRKMPALCAYRFRKGKRKKRDLKSRHPRDSLLERRKTVTEASLSKLRGEKEKSF